MGTTELEVLQQIASNMERYYLGIVLYLGVLTGVLLGLIFWANLKE